MSRRKSSLDNKLKRQQMQYASDLFLSAIESTAKEIVSQAEKEDLIRERLSAIEELEISEGYIITWSSGVSYQVIKILPDLSLRLESWDEIDPRSLLKLKK